MNKISEPDLDPKSFKFNNNNNNNNCLFVSKLEILTYGYIMFTILQ